MPALLPTGRPTAAQVEPVIPLVLGLHGLAICAFGQAPAWTALPFLAVVLLGVAGLVGWSSVQARWARAVLLTGTALALSVLEHALVPSLLQWYYCVAAVYPLLLWGGWVWAVGPVLGGCYVTQVLAGAAPVPLGVAVLRCGVLTALGLVTWTTGVAYRALAREAEEGRREAEAAGGRLAHAASHDSLTGLPNRTMLQAGLAAALQADAPVTLLLLDLDRFKEVNDTLGHRYGDLLLAQVGERLAAVVEPGDVVARLGGDEFAVLLAGAGERRGRAVADAMRDALQEPFLVDEALVGIDASIGIAVAVGGVRDGDLLLQHADVAMYDAKARGTGCSVHRPEMDQHGARSLELLTDLRGAIGRGELVVEYQPKVRSTDRSTTGMEALVRWNHPLRGRIMPDVFIPLAERSGVIAQLTTHVLDVALAQCRAWQDAGLRFGVSVNLSARNLSQEDLPEQVAAALVRASLPGSALELEITESFLMADLVRARVCLARLDAMGVGLAIDDFGTGLSSLAYLKNLPVHVLKIDKSFITRMLDELADTLIVKGIVDLANSLGLETVAEGVEDDRTLQHLATIGCAHAQGWVISRPLPADAVLDWCRRHEQEVAHPGVVSASVPGPRAS